MCEWLKGSGCCRDHSAGSSRAAAAKGEKPVTLQKKKREMVSKRPFQAVGNFYLRQAPVR